MKRTFPAQASRSPARAAPRDASRLEACARALRSASAPESGDPVGQLVAGGLAPLGGRFFTFETDRRPTMPRTRPPCLQEFRNRIVGLVRSVRMSAELARGGQLVSER